ncbi:M20 family metallopeptidase [Cohnella caldifontis]|uniref:M20 family metallopeptidase n=1 Tax=Cohnella caldifontis TaxID=3027471 RepID=UPI0023ED10DB|nr:M20 family metallopeptidase [Cohnella sp. YIM B05605]
MKYRSLVDPQRVQTVLRDLVAIPSVNPGFPGGHGEEEVACYVRQFFRSNGLQWTDQAVEAGRANVVGELRGAGQGKALLLEAHMDTVQVHGMTVDPFAAKVEGGKMYGRGSCDTKASLAAMMVCLETIKRNGLVPPADVHLAAVADEEISFKGVSALADDIACGKRAYAAAIVGEPTELDLIVAHKGVVRFHVDAHGVASHSSNPRAGVNAIEQMAKIIRHLREWEADYESRKHAWVGSPTHCVSMIQGGVAPNTVPDACRITIDRRTIPGEDSESVWREMKRKLESLRERDPGLNLSVSDPFILDYSMEVSPEEPIVRLLRDNALRYGARGELMGAAYGSDASKLTRVGVPAVVFGPGSIRQAHTKDEWVELRQVVDAAAILIETVMGFRG